MVQLQIIFPLKPGTQERWRRFYQTVEGSRREQFEESCQQAGITGVQVRLMQLPRGEILLLTLTTQEPQKTLQDLATSVCPFNRWAREQVQDLLGWNMKDVLTDPPSDLIFTWSR